MMKKRSNALVTGDDGFLGRVLVDRLKKNGNYVVGVDKERKSANEINYERADMPIIADVRDYDRMRMIMTEYEIDEVYHLASWAIQKHCAADPKTAYDININGLVNILEACKNSRYNIESIVVSTSDKAFGKAPVPYTEETPLDPLFIYDSSKACQQFIALSYIRNFNLPIKIIASSNFYGPGDFNMTRVIPGTITRLANNEPAMLWKDSASHVREFVYIDDVARAFTTVAEKGESGLYLCGGDEHLRIDELMTKICTIMNKDPKKNIEVVERPEFLKEIKEQYIDSRKLRSLGWAPKISLEKGLEKSIDFYTNLTTDKKVHPQQLEDGSLADELGPYFK